jgi:hypothetical protein
MSSHEYRSPAAATSRDESLPPGDPAERPTIEPTDALPTEDLDEPDQDRKSAGGTVPAPPPSSGEEPAPPPADPAQRPTIEPTDALPTRE